MTKNNLPVVMLLGAQSTDIVLKSVPAEVSVVKELFSDAQKDHQFFNLEYEPFLTDTYLKTRLDRFRGNISLLHFAGHSDAEGLLSNGSVIYVKHLAEIFKKWPSPPALIFLNGCNNAEQVKLFHDAGVGLVIATHSPIGDLKAGHFAEEFYKSLLANLDTDVASAFADAGSKVFLNKNEPSRSLDVETLSEADSDNWDWGLFSKQSGQGKWTLQKLLENDRPRYSTNGELLNPYRGLESFRAQDRAYFYGREALTSELVEKIPSSELFMLLGASGSGKSSLISAGVIPSLLDSEKWLVFTTRPSASPFSEMASSFALHFHPENEQSIDRLKKKNEIEKALSTQQIELSSLLADIQASSEKDNVLLFIDQFEELFTQSSLSVTQIFQEQLARLVEAKLPRCHLLLVMRADFLSAALTNPSFAKLLDQHPSKLLAPMGQAELRAAIEKPANKQQVIIEPILTEALLDAVENQSGSLPILQYVLSLLWEKRKNNQITLDDYNCLGGLEKALETRADAIFEKLSTDEQDQGKKILLRLIQSGEGSEDTRRRALLSEFADTSQIQGIIKNLVDERLITTRNEGSETEGYIEVAHEALIRSWPRLKNWIDENRDSIRIQSRFAEAAKVWSQEGENTSQDYVYRGALLASIEEWATSPEITLSSIERDFLDTSVEIRDRERKEDQQRKELELKQAMQLLDEQKKSTKKQRRFFAVLGVFVLALGLVAGFALEVSKKAEEDKLRLAEVEEKQKAEQNRTDIEGDLTVFGAVYGEHPKEQDIAGEVRGVFTSSLEKYIFTENINIVEATSLAAEKMKKEKFKQRPELVVSLNGKVFLNPVSKKRKLYSLVFGWGKYQGTGLTSLPGAENDAKSIHKFMNNLGYNSKLYLNIDSVKFEEIIADLLKEIEENCVPSFVERPFGPNDFTSVKLCQDTAVFLHLAGHGLSKNGITYAIPLDYKSGMKSNEKLINIESLRARLSKKIPLRIIITDISRGDDEYEIRM